MQQDLLLHFWVIFLYWNRTEIWKKIFCCPALELFHCLPPLFRCLPLWTTVRPHGKKLQNATKALRFTSHRQPENLWNPLVISYTLDFPIWFVFCITLSRNKTLISLACIFFSWKDAELFLFMPCIWNHNLRIYMVHNLQNVYGILANDGLTSFLKEHLIVLLTCVFTKHLVKESYEIRGAGK